MKKFILDVYPAKAQFLKNEEIGIVIELNNFTDEEKGLDVEVSLFFLNEIVEKKSYHIVMASGDEFDFAALLEPKDEEFKGYGVEVCLYENNMPLEVVSTAFDVVSSWKKATRYGFLSDFYDKDSDKEDIQSMNKLHLNIIQFYDWMYRHDNLVPPSPRFKDLMGRELNYEVVRSKVRHCHEYGMRAMAYGAVYAASYDFFKEHMDWALYDSSDRPLSLGETFFIMNIARECPWHNHIIDQYRQAIEDADFDGIHMDTYGFPKTAKSKHNGGNKVESLREQFPELINDTKEELARVKDDVGLIFNNVGNWPVDTVGEAEQEAIYIEVWKPYERYHHIQEIIKWAKYLGKNKPVILAAYLKPFVEADNVKSANMAALILTAAIASNGAYHLLLGEKNGVLNQGYYVNYSTLEEGFVRTIRNYYDFLVRYSNIFFDDELNDVSMTHIDGDNLEYTFEGLDYSTYGEGNKVWVIAREKAFAKSISFINITNNEDYWNRGKNEPDIIGEFKVKMLIDRKVKAVFIASPDKNMGRPEEVEYLIEESVRGKALVIDFPRLEVWSTLYVEFMEDCC